MTDRARRTSAARDCLARAAEALTPSPAMRPEWAAFWAALALAHLSGVEGAEAGVHAIFRAAAATGRPR